MILVYKTNFDTNVDIEYASTILKSFNEIVTWSIDNEDIDNVLRIVSKVDISDRLVPLLNQTGYSCSELI